MFRVQDMWVVQA